MKSKTIFILIMIVMIGTLFTTTVKAEYSAKVQMTVNQTEVNPGDTINIIVNLVDVIDAGTGVSEMGGTIEYDSQFFDSITASQGSWMVNEKNGKFTLSGNILTQDGQFAILQFHVSEKASGSTTVKFTDLLTANGETEPTSPDITLTFKIKENEQKPENTNNTTGDNNTITPENNNTNTSTDTNTTTNKIQGNKTNTVTSISKLPNAGIRNGIIIGAVILVFVMIGSYLLYRYPKIK